MHFVFNVSVSNLFWLSLPSKYILYTRQSYIYQLSSWNFFFLLFFFGKHTDFAGIVEYDVIGFLEKNRDTLTEDLVDMLRSSDHSFLKTMYPSDGPVTSTSSRKASLAKQFQKQLKDLMGQLYATEPHYIRCIKPNDSKAGT